MTRFLLCLPTGCNEPRSVVAHIAKLLCTYRLWGVLLLAWARPVSYTGYSSVFSTQDREHFPKLGLHISRHICPLHQGNKGFGVLWQSRTHLGVTKPSWNCSERGGVAGAPPSQQKMLLDLFIYFSTNCENSHRKELSRPCWAANCWQRVSVSTGVMLGPSGGVFGRSSHAELSRGQAPGAGWFSAVRQAMESCCFWQCV